MILALRRIRSSRPTWTTWDYALKKYLHCNTSVFLALRKSKLRVIQGQLKTLVEIDSVLEHKWTKQKNQNKQIFKNHHCVFISISKYLLFMLKDLISKAWKKSKIQHSWGPRSNPQWEGIKQVFSFFKFQVPSKTGREGEASRSVSPYSLSLSNPTEPWEGWFCKMFVRIKEDVPIKHKKHSAQLQTCNRCHR